MALLCNDGCVSTATLPGNYQDFCAPPVRRKSGWGHFVLVPCETSFDPTSAADWLANGELSPEGKVTFGTPSINTTDELKACGEEVILDTSITFDFETANVAADGSDMDYFKTLLKNYERYNIAFISCDGRVTIAGDYADAVTATDYSPGYSFNITEPPHEIEKSNYLAAWRWQGTITFGDIGMIEWDYVPGIEAALKATTT